MALGGQDGFDDAEFDYGFIASRLQDAEGHWRLRAAGPFFEYVDTGTGARFSALRPFYAFVEDAEQEKSAGDLVWPLASIKRFRHERSWRMLTAWHTDFDADDPRSRSRLWILPVFFMGTDRAGDSYAALFPLGGSIHGILMQDRASFVLFPLWMRTRMGTVETTHVMWPIYARAEGRGIKRLRVFPLYGRTRHRDQYEKGFALWPVWTWVRHYHPNATGSGYVLFPLWGRVEMSDQSTWMFLPPLIRIDRGEQMQRVHAPWPLVQWSAGEVDKIYLWPLWGHKRQERIRSWFALWPLIRSYQTQRDGAQHTRFSVLPFFSSQSIRENAEENGTGALCSRRLRLWPLLDYRADADARRIQLLALWPFSDPPPVARSWSPLWTVFSDHAVEDRRDTELLWGLFRRRRRGEAVRTQVFPLFARHKEAGHTSGWSLLGGLLERERRDDTSRWRLLYWPPGQPAPTGRPTEKEQP